MDLRSDECDVVSLYVACLTVFLNCFVKQLAICLGCILLLNVMDLFSVVGGALLDRPCRYSKECVCCACDPNERLSAPSICLFVFCMSEVISSFKSLRDGSQVFALLILLLCVILHTMSSGKSQQLLCTLPLGMLCLYAIMFVKIMFAVRILVWAKADFVSSVNCVHSAFF